MIVLRAMVWTVDAMPDFAVIRRKPCEPAARTRRLRESCRTPEGSAASDKEGSSVTDAASVSGRERGVELACEQRVARESLPEQRDTARR